MKKTTLDENFSVSGQISPEDLRELNELGVQLVVCNRPDGEAAEQPAFAEIQTVAGALGMETVQIAFGAGQMAQSQVSELARLLASGRKIHAYCRSGTRSKMLWEAARQAPVAGKISAPAGAAGSHYQVVVVGAGSGGVALAASLLKRRPGLKIALIDPSECHYYQPGWTMVGGGIFDVASTRRLTSSVIPAGVTWIQEAVEKFAPAENKLLLSGSNEIYYDQLIVAAGLKLNWQAVEGLSEALGKNGVTSNYCFELAPYTWELVQKTRRGKALFTQPPMPIKCAGAPQKALYLSADHWYRNGLLQDIEVHFYNAGAVLFGVKDYVPALSSYMEKYRANLHFSHNLVRVDGDARKAWFRVAGEDGSEQLVESDFDMLHVCPPQCAPDFIRSSELADGAGWVDVDPATLRHKKFANIWGLGDVTNTPNAKTMAAVRKQVPVVAQNLCDVLDGKQPQCAYDGYGSCPLTVERGKIVLAEFGYGGRLLPTFPKWLNDGTKATRLAWELKARFLPDFYWHGMLKGREWLTGCSVQEESSTVSG